MAGFGGNATSVIWPWGLARAGKVKNQTPKVAKAEKKKAPESGRKRIESAEKRPLETGIFPN